MTSLVDVPLAQGIIPIRTPSVHDVAEVLSRAAAAHFWVCESAT
jgi:hypothetical protein